MGRAGQGRVLGLEGEWSRLLASSEESLRVRVTEVRIRMAAYMPMPGKHRKVCVG